MAEEMSKTIKLEPEQRSSFWPWRWIRTSISHIIASEQRLLSLVRSGYVQEDVNIGSGAPGSKVKWFRSVSNEPRFINTLTFESRGGESAPTLVMVHGYGASHGFFFRNFDALASRFKVIAIDQLGCHVITDPKYEGVGYLEHYDKICGMASPTIPVFVLVIAQQSAASNYRVFVGGINVFLDIQIKAFTRIMLKLHKKH
eukprot:Gb_30726 [translate_table: standard]